MEDKQAQEVKKAAHGCTSNEARAYHSQHDGKQSDRYYQDNMTDNR